MAISKSIIKWYEERAKKGLPWKPNLRKRACNGCGEEMMGSTKTLCEKCEAKLDENNVLIYPLRLDGRKHTKKSRI